MPYIPPEVVQEVKRMDLLTYLKNYEPYELVHFSGNTYTTRTHDSLKISKLKKWYAADGYKLTSYEVRYNNMNGRFYIYARMYKQPQEGEKIDKATSKIKQKTAKKKAKKKTAARCST